MSTNVVDASGERDTPRPNQSIQVTIQKYLVGLEEQKRAYGVLARLLLHVTRTPSSYSGSQLEAGSSLLSLKTKPGKDYLNS